MLILFVVRRRLLKVLNTLVINLGMFTAFLAVGEGREDLEKERSLRKTAGNSSSQREFAVKILHKSTKEDGGMAQAMELLPHKPYPLSSHPNTTKRAHEFAG